MTDDVRSEGIVHLLAEATALLLRVVAVENIHHVKMIGMIAEETAMIEEIETANSMTDAVPEVLWTAIENATETVETSVTDAMTTVNLPLTAMNVKVLPISI